MKSNQTVSRHFVFILLSNLILNACLDTTDPLSASSDVVDKTKKAISVNTGINLKKPDIDVKVSVSRKIGVAPLSVFFDATETTSKFTTNPFHELEYKWNFGDINAGNWTNGSLKNSKNIAMGGLAGHVYEQPGKYKVSLAVKSETLTVSYNEIEIEVLDPNAFFTQENTFCFSVGSDFSECPSTLSSSHIQISTGDLASAFTATTFKANARILFKRGEIWYSSSYIRLDKDGPWIVGAFGTGAKPIIRSTSTSSIFAFGKGGEVHKDGTLMDLTLDGQGNAVLAVSGFGTFDNLLVMHMDLINVQVGVSLSYSTPNLVRIWDHPFIYENTIGPIVNTGGGNGMYVSATRMSTQGNNINNYGLGEHNFRSMFFNKLILANNTFSSPKSTKASITLRAPPFGEGTGTFNNSLPPGTISETAIIAQNEVIGASGVTVPINTSIDSAYDARTVNLIFERNWVHSQPDVQTAISLNSSNSTIRYNLFDLSDSSKDSYVCTSIGGHTATPTPSNNNVYNNTCYSSKVFPAINYGLKGIKIFARSDNTFTANNLIYVPNANRADTSTSSNVFSIDDLTSPSSVIGLSGENGNSSNADGKVNPLFVLESSPLTPINAVPQSGSYTQTNGIKVKGHFSDFFGNSVGSTEFTGAFH